MPPLNCRVTSPDIGVVVLSQFVSPAYALALLADGTNGRAYLLKDSVDDLDRLVDAVRAVARRRIGDRSAGGRGSWCRPRSQPTNSVLKSLTPRELEILREIATGKSNAAIAATVFLSERAIEKHTNSIFSKLGITAEPDMNRRVKAVLMYLSEQTRPG